MAIGIQKTKGTSMKVKKVNRYYCEFCHKGGQSASCMSVHEKHCGLNPKRECRLCKKAVDIEKAREILGPPLTDSEKAECEELGYHHGTEEKTILDKLHDLCDGCPNCMLAAFKQTGHHGAAEFGWIYSDAKSEWWAEQNAERSEY